MGAFLPRERERELLPAPDCSVNLRDDNDLSGNHLKYLGN